MVLISYLNYRSLHEMAIPGRGPTIGSVSKIPIDHSASDPFLKQTREGRPVFNISAYDEVSHQRLDMLWEVVKNLQEIRDKISGVIRKGGIVEFVPGGLADKIKNYLTMNAEDRANYSELTSKEKEFIEKRHTFPHANPNIEKEIEEKRGKIDSLEQQLDDLIKSKNIDEETKKDIEKKIKKLHRELAPLIGAYRLSKKGLAGRSALPLIPGKTDKFWGSSGDPKVSDKEIQQIAEDDTHEIIKRRTENLYKIKGLSLNGQPIADESGKQLPVVFKIPRQGKGGPLLIRALPYFNELYHYLERTRGELHHPESGLAGQGKHGYDLSHPLEKEKIDDKGNIVLDKKTKQPIMKRTTRGMTIPEKTTWTGAFFGVPRSQDANTRAGYLAHSAYGHFGSLEKLPAYQDALNDEELEWLPMDGSDKSRPEIIDPKIEWLIDSERTQVKIDCHKAKLAKGHETEGGASVPDFCGIDIPPGTNKEEAKKIKKENAKSLIDECERRIKLMVKEGKVHAHKIPDPDNLVPESYREIGKDRQYKLDSQGNILNQYIFLPFRVVRKENGSIDWVIPILPDSHPLERSNVEKHAFAVGKGKGVKMFYKHKVDPKNSGEEFKRTDLSVDDDEDAEETSLETGERTRVMNVGVTPNRNVKAQVYSDPKIASEAWRKEYLESLMVNSPEGLVVPEFIEGIKSTLRGNLRSGSLPQAQQEQILNDKSIIYDLHQLVVSFVLSKSLASSNLLTPAGRHNLAVSTVSSSYQAIGGGKGLAGLETGLESRRARQYAGARVSSKDEPTGDEGESRDVSDADIVRAAGVKASRIPWNLDSIRDALDSQTQAIEALAEKQKQDRSKEGLELDPEDYEGNLKKLSRLMQQTQERSKLKLSFLEIVKNLLQQIKNNYKDKIIDFDIEKTIKSWQETFRSRGEEEAIKDHVLQIIELLQKAEEGEKYDISGDHVQMVEDKPIKPRISRGPATPFVRAKMAPKGPSPLLRRPIAPQQEPAESTPETQSEWNELSLSERIEFYKKKLKK